MYNLQWTRLALQDVEHIYNYIAEERKERARGVVNAMQELVGKLSYHPFIGKEGRKTGTREFVIPHTSYVIVYRLHNNTVQILRILHTAQKYP